MKWSLSFRDDESICGSYKNDENCSSFFFHPRILAQSLKFHFPNFLATKNNFHFLYQINFIVNAINQRYVKTIRAFVAIGQGGYFLGFYPQP